MGRTSIEWTDHSINPIKFQLALAQATEPVLVNMCTKCSPGCTNCYAEAMTRRWWKAEWGEFPGYTAQAMKRGAFVLDVGKLYEVLRRRQPTKFFWCDMTDMFHENVPFELVDACFAVMALTPHHTHQVLTKRDDREAEYIATRTPIDDSHQVHTLPQWYQLYTRWFDEGFGDGRFFETEREWDRAHDAAERVDPTRPLPNVWLGVSVEDQKRADARREHLASVAHAGWTTWVSYEPAHAPVDWSGWEFLRWMVSGGESGAKALSSPPAAHRRARDFCTSHGIAYLFKQWGEWLPYEQDAQPPLWNGQDGTDIDGHVFPDRLGDGDPVKGWWCPDLLDGVVYRRRGKTRAGRRLDGRTWDEMPTLLTAGAEVRS